MKKFTAVILVLFCFIAAAGCGFGSSSTEASTEDGFAIDGYFLRLTDGDCLIVLDEKSQNKYGDAYMRLNAAPPWNPPVALDGYETGDYVSIAGLTIADLDPRVFDLSGIELKKKGNADNIPAEIRALFADRIG